VKKTTKTKEPVPVEEKEPVRYSLLVANHALLNAPIFETHSRGSNWLAVIDVDASQPGGLSRRFMPRGRGECLYTIEQLSLFDPVEFGADYTSSFGGKKRDRWYGVVTALTEGSLIVEQAPSGAFAVIRAKEARTSIKDRVAAKEALRKEFLERAAELEDEISTLKIEDGEADESKSKPLEQGSEASSAEAGGEGIQGLVSVPPQ
jgi:hypothetical protein